MAQRYTDPDALSRMADGLCPECGNLPERHSDDYRFWIPRTCTLLPHGVTERIAQFREDLDNVPPP